MHRPINLVKTFCLLWLQFVSNCMLKNNNQAENDMKYTKEEIIKRITTQLDECLESANAEIYNYDDKIVDVDIDNQTITIRFDYHVVEDDDYVGLGFY